MTISSFWVGRPCSCDEWSRCSGAPTTPKIIVCSRISTLYVRVCDVMSQMWHVCFPRQAGFPATCRAAVNAGHQRSAAVLDVGVCAIHQASALPIRHAAGLAIRLRARRLGRALRRAGHDGVQSLRPWDERYQPRTSIARVVPVVRRASVVDARRRSWRHLPGRRRVVVRAVHRLGRRVKRRRRILGAIISWSSGRTTPGTRIQTSAPDKV